MRRAALGFALLVMLGWAAVMAVAQAYPHCDWKCTSNDVLVTEIYVSGPDVCMPGDPVSGGLWVTLYNRTGTDRYAVRFVGDLYADGAWMGSYEECVAESVPPGTTTVMLASLDWICGEVLGFRDLVISWTTKKESCGDEPDCTDRKTKCSSEVAIPITGTPLAVDFSFDEPVCEGSSVGFVDATAGGTPPYLYFWDFGDSIGNSAEDNPSYLYSAPGTYPVTLTVTDEAGRTGTAMYEVTVAAFAEAEAFNGGPYCVGDTIELFASGGVEYSWSGPDGFESVEQEPVIPSAAEANAGTYAVWVTNRSGCSAEAWTVVELDGSPPRLTLPPDVEIECGEAIDPSVTGEATAVDDRDPFPTVSYTDVVDLVDCDGTTGTIERTWIAADACGNEAIAVQRITIVDRTPPTLGISSIELECDGTGNESEIRAWLASAVGVDRCSDVIVSNDYVGLSGSCPGTGRADVTFVATDACGHTTERVATVTVVDTTAPSAEDDTASTDEDAAVTIDVLANDADLCGDGLEFESVGVPTAGGAEIEGRQIRYVPPADFHGSATFSYTIIDCAGNPDTATVTVTVLPANDPPVANDETVTTTEDTPIGITVTATDPDGEELTYAMLSGPSHGRIDGFDATTGELTYVPGQDVHGTDEFTFEACDPSGACDTGRVRITVEPADDPPSADPQRLTTPEDTPVAVVVTGSDADGEPITYAIVSGPSHGRIDGFDATTGELTYVPDENYTGTDRFVFEACDPHPEHGCAQATVTIEVEPVNDPPVASDQTRVTAEDTATGFFSLAIADPDDGLADLSCDCVAPPQHGTVERGANHTVNYTPEADYVGTDRFTYEVCDPSGACDTATVTITVTNENDNPTVTAEDRTTNEDTPVDVAIEHGDPDGDRLSCRVSEPQHGTVEPVEATVVGPYPSFGSVRYTPDAGYAGTDQFTITCDDGNGGTDAATVEITVLPVNDPPAANDETVTTTEDTPIGITVTATDPDGDELTYAILSGPSHGRIDGFDATTGELTYVPGQDFHGTEEFTFEACDPSGACDTGRVRITVEPADDPPSADPQRLTTPEDRPVAVVVTGSDADGEPITYAIVSGPSHGRIDGFDATTGELTYVPDENYTGTDRFVFEACDPHPEHGCAQATVTIDVEPVNDPPVASDQTRVTAEDTATGFFSLAIGDPDDGLADLSCDCVTPPQHGTVERGANHTVNYTPEADFFGVDTFSYVVCDPDGSCDTATVTVTVLPANDPPRLEGRSYLTSEDTPIGIALTATDPDGDELTYAILSGPGRGELVDFDPARGTGTYVPDPGYAGPDSLFVSACDPGGGCDVATIELLVVPVNDAPTAVCFDSSVTQGVPVDLTLRASDPESDPLTFDITVGPGHGRIERFNPQTGDLVYVPDANYAGPDELTFRVCDDSGACDACVIQLLVVRVAGAGGGGEPCAQRVILSEIGWAGTKAGEDHEWIELRNLEPEPVALVGWTLRWRPAPLREGRAGAWRTVALEGVVGPAMDDVAVRFEANPAQAATWWGDVPTAPRGDLFLLERGSDDILSLVAADLVYTDEIGAPEPLDLDDTGAMIELIDPSGCTVDTANLSALAEGGWSAGSTSPPSSMERVDPYGPDDVGNWRTNRGLIREGFDGMANLVHGTPRAMNEPMLADLVARSGLAATLAVQTEPLRIRLETKPEWPLDAGLWYVVVIDGRSGETLPANWAIESDAEGEAVIVVSIEDGWDDVVHVWVRTPIGTVLVAPFDLGP